MTNPRYFEYALKIEQFGSFKRAALELHLSQPALSKGIAALEQEYGIVLFDRESRPLIPTESGRIVLEEARRILEGDRQLRTRLMQQQQVISYQVRIAFGPYAGKIYAVPFAREFRKHFPKAELHLQTCSWQEPPLLLRNRQVDLFLADISSDYLQEEFSIEPLPPEPVQFICSSAHALAEKNRITLNEIFHHPFALCSPPPWAKQWLKTSMANFDPRESPAKIRTDDFRMISDFLISDSCLGSLGTSSSFRDEIDRGLLVSIPIENAPCMQAGIAYPKKGARLPILDQVLDILHGLVSARPRTQ